MNNLDPEVAERPDDLVVYGGTGRAARDWKSFDAHGAHAAPRSRHDETMLVQSRPPGRRHADPRVGAARAHRQLQPGRRLGHLAGVPPARAPRPDDVRPDDRRLVDLHRHPGHPAGHLRDLRRGRREALRRHARRHAHPHRRLRRHGRRPAARRHHERRRLPDRRRRPGPPAPPRRAPLPRRGRRPTSTTPSTRRSPPRRERRGWSVGVVGNAAEVFPELLRRGVADRHRHRPDLGARPAVATCPRASRSRTGHEYAEKKPEEFTDRARASMAKHVAGDGRVPGRRRRGLRLRQLDPRRGPPGRLRPRLRVPRLRAGLHPAAVLRGQGPVPLGRALRRPARTSPPPTRPSSTSSPTTSTLHRWIRRPPRSGSRSRACRPGSAGSATASATKAGLRFNELVADGRGQGARSSSAATTSTPARVASPVPRDRGHARRLRRDRRLAAAQRPASTPPPAPPGSRSTTAAASASAAPSTPARSPSPTAPTSPRRSSRACSPTTPAWASSATSTPATTSPIDVAHGARRPHPDARGLRPRMPSPSPDVSRGHL